MSLTEKKEIDRIEVVNDWNIQVRESTIIQKDGQQIAQTFHRWVLTPDMDISTQEEKVKNICNAVWTPEVVAAYEAFKAEQANRLI